MPSAKGKGKGKGAGSENAAVELSRQICQVLRHSAFGLGLKIRPDGYVLLSELMKVGPIQKLKPSLDAIQHIVKTNDKQRFSLYEDSTGTWIRANQGHSIEGINMDLLCGDPVHELREGEVCCHGTLERHLRGILTKGLIAGGQQGQAYRRDVHFSIKNPGEDVVSGFRHNAQIAVYVNLPRAAQSGIRFYRSANDVILSEGIDGVVPPRFIERIMHIQKGVQLWPKAEVNVENGSSVVGQPKNGTDSGSSPKPKQQCTDGHKSVGHSYYWSGWNAWDSWQSQENWHCQDNWHTWSKGETWESRNSEENYWGQRSWEIRESWRR